MRRFVNQLSLFLLLLGVITPFSGIAQQSKSLVGSVYTSDDTPFAYATVRLKNTRFATSVLADGSYELQAPAGNYTLSISYANYIVYEEPIQLLANQTVYVPKIIVPSKHNQLREVIVSDIQTNKFARKETEDIARMPLANLQNPQAYSVITKDLFQELGAVTYNTALSQASGTIAMTGLNDNGNDIYLRGFSMYKINRNGLPLDTRVANEIFSLEKIEVLKGPSATLFGSEASSYGGVINNVTKKPFESFRGEVSYTTGSWGLNRLTADVNTPLNADRTALARFNVLGTTENSFQDAGKIQSFGFATSLLFKANDRTTIRFDAEVLNSKKPLMALLRNTTNFKNYKSMEEVPLPYDRALYSDDISTPRSNISINAELEYKLSENWTSRTSYLFNQSGDKNSVFLVPMVINDNQIQRSYANFDSYTLNYNTIQQNFNGNYNLGSLKNQVVIGGEYSLVSSYNLTQEPWFTVYDVINIDDNFWKPMTLAEVNKTRAEQSIGSALTTTQYASRAAYLSHVTNIADRFFVLLSARFNSYHQDPSQTFNPGTPAKPEETFTETEAYTQNNISPKVGLVYQIVKDKISLYSNYSNSFKNNGSQMGYKNIEAFNNGETAALIKFDPETANQLEVGAKFEMFNKKLNATVAYFDITVDNTIRSLGVNAAIQDGKFNSKGFELDIIANPVKGWQLIFGYLNNKSKYIQAAENLIGKRPAWSPENTLNVWTSYKIHQGSCKGIGVGVGAKYIDKVTLSGSEGFYIPANTIINGTLFYDQPKYRVGLNLNNITNKKYWNFGTKPQKPFEFLASLSFKF